MERLGRFYSYLTGGSGRAAAPVGPAPLRPDADAAAVRIRVTPFVTPTLAQALAAPPPPPPAALEEADFVAIDIREAPAQPPGSDDEALEPGPLVIHSPQDARRPAYQRGVVHDITRADGERYRVFVNDRADIERGNLPRAVRKKLLQRLRQDIAQQQVAIQRLDRAIADGERALLEAQRAQPVQARAPVTRITPDQTAATGWRVGKQLALRDAISQAVGRVSGLAATAGMRVAAASSETARRNVEIGGAITLVAACAVFGSRMSELLVKGFNIRDRRTLAQAAFLLTPLLLQAGLPLVGAYCGKAGTGVKLLAVVVGRLVAALGRDGLTQCQAGLWSSAKIVRPDGKAADLHTVLHEVDPYRLKVAFVRYVASSLLLLVGGRALLDRWIISDGSNSFHDLMRTGMTTVIPSVLNEAFDGLNGTLAGANAAIASGLALQHVPAQGLMPCDSPAHWSDLASRIRSHAGSRMVFGSFTADPWILGAELYPDSSAADLGFRLVGGMLNGLTEYRGHSVERGNRPAQSEAYRREQAEHTVADQRARAEHDTVDAAIRYAQDSARSGKFQRTRQELFERMRQSVLDAKIVQPQEMPSLDAVIENVYGAEINEAVAEAFMAQSREAVALQRGGAYDIFYGRNDGILEFVPIHREPAMDEESDPTPIGSPQQGTPLLGPSHTAQSSSDLSQTSTPQRTPMPAHRRPTLPGSQALSGLMPRHLRPGQQAWVDGWEVRFDGFAAGNEERKASGAGHELMAVSAAEAIEALNWPQGEQDDEGRWVYRLSWQQHAVTGTPPRHD